ncbi:O-antigen ligase family protein [Selenomonas sp. WCA-380-WT-3B 3/]|uniref:O-antigen ligase family protein n=1 Tax=Selenomonas montiformis TaxID=2652285 RepID=A0A6I2UWM0_9FIRM|nr:O-antigen ligase family protein [Selenomonas montiformis]
MIINEKIAFKLFFLAVVMLPFNGTLIIDALSRISKHGQTYPVLLLVVFGLCFCLMKKKIILPKRTDAIIYLFFLVSVLLSGVTNVFGMNELVFQGKNGIYTYIISLFKLMLFYIVPLMIINIFHSRKESLINIFERGVHVSIIIVVLYSFVELLSLMGGPIGIELKEFIDNNFINIGRNSSDIVDLTQMVRVHSVASEASYFAMYVLFVIPYIIKLCIEKSNYRIIYVLLFIYFTLLLVFSFSRTAYFGYVLMTMFTIIAVRRYVNVKKILLGITMVVLLLGIIFFNDDDLVNMMINVFFSFNNDTGFLGSNAARFGSTVAALKIFTDYPICGVGWGEYGFYASDYYPQWAWISQEIMIWSSNTTVDGDWPPVHNLYAKLLAETGALGLISFVIMFIRCLYVIYQQYLLSENEKRRSWIVFGISFFSLLLSAFNVDSIYYIYWIMIGVLWKDYKLVPNNR